MSSELIYTVTDFVAICNQVFDVSFGSVQITGELSSFKVSKNRWVYFDLKDDYSTLRFFGNVYQLPGPLEDGMILTVHGVPQLHPKFGFSINVQSIQLAGEGTIKKAAQLLEYRLTKEGLFDEARKRPLPYPPKVIGVISSAESAGYADFIKIVNERWSGLQIRLLDVQVQGEKAPGQIIEAVQYFNQHSSDIDVLVVIRGGGSADDLQAFSHEGVTRAVAASRVPTLVAIGHETDVSLAEKAADVRASTPSNAAQLLLPDKQSEQKQLLQVQKMLINSVARVMEDAHKDLVSRQKDIQSLVMLVSEKASKDLEFIKKNLGLLDPSTILKRGYAIVRQNRRAIQSARSLNTKQDVELQFYDGLVHVKPKESGTL